MEVPKIVRELRNLQERVNDHSSMAKSEIDRISQAAFVIINQVIEELENSKA